MNKKFNELFKENQMLVYILATILIFVVSYGSGITDYIYNHDSSYRIYDGIQSLESGRFLRGPLNELLSFGTYSSMNAALLTYIGFLCSSYGLIKLFNIKSLFHKLLISALIFTYPIFSFYWAYGNDIWQYSFAFAASIFAIYFVVRQGVKNKLIAIGLVIFMLGIYQSFLSSLTALFVVYYLIKALDLDVELNIKEMIVNLSILIIGALLYFVFLKVTLLVTGVELSSYQDASSIGLVSIITTLPHSIKLAYLDAANHMMAQSKFFSSQLSYGIINSIIYVSYILLVIELFVQKHSKKKVLIVVLMVLLLPIFENSILFISNNIRHYSVFGYAITVVGALLIYIKIMPKANWYYVIFLIYIYSSIFQVQQMLFFQEQQTSLNEQVATTIVTDLQRTQDYTADTKVTFCSDIESDYIQFSSFSSIEFSSPLYSSGVNGYIFNELYPYHLSSLFRNLGYELNVTEDKCSADVRNGAAYPREGYITGNEEHMYINL